MKLYGYKDEGKDPSEIEPQELAEVTISANAQELRQMASFLTSVAEQIESLGSSFQHAHLSDLFKSFRGDPQFVVFNSDAKP
jgi:hypothetical protein